MNCRRCRRKLKAHELMNKSRRYGGVLCDGCQRFVLSSIQQNEPADIGAMTQLDKILRKRWA